MTEPTPPVLDPRPKRMNHYTLPSVGHLAVFREFFYWCIPFARYAFSRLYGRWILRVTEEERTARSVKILMSLGTRGAVFARIASRRIDLLPLQVCLGLRRIQDAQPPFELQHMLDRVAAVTKRPHEHSIAHVHPEPLGSNSVFCSWRARLVDGREVVIKMRRPGVDRELTVMLRVLRVFWALGELMTLVPIGMAQRMGNEFQKAIQDDLDFRWQGQLQMAFRRHARVNRVRFASTCEVLPEFLDHDIMVTQFVEGVSLARLLHAVENQDQAALRAIKAQGIDPKRVARNLMFLSWYLIFEGIFFLPDPQPKSIIIMENSRLMLTSMDSGDCMPQEKTRLIQRALERLAEDDVSRAGFAMLHLIAPLPSLDTYDLAKKLESRLGPVHYRTRNPASPWPDRTTLGIWGALLDTTKQFGIPLRLPIVRVIRGEMNYTMFAGMVDRELDIWKTFDRYRRKSFSRIIRRHRQNQARNLQARPTALLAQGYLRASQQLDDSSVFLETFARDTPLVMNSTARKGTYVVRIFSKTATFVATMALLLAVYGGVTTHQRIPTFYELTDQLALLTQSVAFLVLIWVSFIWASRVVLIRIHDVDEG